MVNASSTIIPTNESILTKAGDGDQESSPTTPPDDDEFFIRRTLEQDVERGIELLYRRYFGPLCTHTVRFVRSRETAEDIVSEIFYQFYTEQLFLKITSSYRAYLFKAVRNRAYNHLRREFGRRTPLDETISLPESESYQPDAITQYEELYQDMERAINTLPIQRRKIYLLHHFGGKPAGEIAEELHLSVRTVEGQVYRAHQAIRQIMRVKWLLSIALMVLPQTAIFMGFCGAIQPHFIH